MFSVKIILYKSISIYHIENIKVTSLWIKAKPENLISVHSIPLPVCLLGLLPDLVSPYSSSPLSYSCFWEDFGSLKLRTLLQPLLNLYEALHNFFKFFKGPVADVGASLFQGCHIACEFSRIVTHIKDVLL